MLNASMRTSVATLPIVVFLMIDASMLKSPGPRTVLRAVLPNVPVESDVCWKHDVLNHCPIVGLLETGSQIVFGRLFVRPVDVICCVCVIVIGSPDRRYNRLLTCQPPHARCAAHGS